MEANLNGGAALAVALGPIRAAQYVRMSTDQQRYSIANQIQVNGAYAGRRGMVIVRTYADEGKSGLNIEKRDALKQLIKDAVTGQADFATILVYDVSRWGRFQGRGRERALRVHLQAGGHSRRVLRRAV
jgi:DNA invertase Pin-like site-specific DNA recombinase